MFARAAQTRQMNMRQMWMGKMEAHRQRRGSQSRGLVVGLGMERAWGVTLLLLTALRRTWHFRRGYFRSAETRHTVPSGRRSRTAHWRASSLKNRSVSHPRATLNVTALTASRHSVLSSRYNGVERFFCRGPFP